MTDSTTIPPRLVRIGIASCLLGEPVRFDGGHKRQAFLVDTLGPFVHWVPVCPEVEIGLGTPRESLRLVGSPQAPRLLAPRSQRDYTETMQRFAAQRLEALAGLGLHGYILKKDSPSCGMQRVRVYGAGEDGTVQRQGRGLFAAALMQRFPLLPIEDEGRLQDMALRENFVERVFAYARWSALLALPPTPQTLVQFHTQHKLTVLAHSRVHYDRLGRLVAQAGTLPLADVLCTYGVTFMDGLKIKATTRKHANVLYHLLGHVKKSVTADDKVEVVTFIEAYRCGLFPLVVPLTLLQHHLRRHAVPWALEQTYLQPYPMELMLRNHV